MAPALPPSPSHRGERTRTSLEEEVVSDTPYVALRAPSGDSIPSDEEGQQQKGQSPFTADEIVFLQEMLTAYRSQAAPAHHRRQGSSTARAVSLLAPSPYAIPQLHNPSKDHSVGDHKQAETLYGTPTPQPMLSMDGSEYPAFMESTHAWAVFADDPQTSAGWSDRLVGILIILFQLFTYWLFAREAIDDYQKSLVPVQVAYATCAAAPDQVLDAANDNDISMTCEADTTNPLDAGVAFFMLGMFLAADILQAGHVLRAAPWSVFAWLAALEVAAAFGAATLAISYHLTMGQVTDAVEVGVGLLFIRDLSKEAYRGIRQNHTKRKQYKVFFFVVAVLVVLGMGLDALYEKIFSFRDYF